ncbi:hypothetical protein H310_11394 [Aphanomyces invadans]|uniref:Uncharacterized protein n=1 Tax=Aphanomyces invadans TaxID=157072 RepID=A0A024TM93_9STRA|nr:hypothetical protein H310_11394 [Aphanomyces invadans]ETV95119.1 hypothetical protein H310_11394 [Aphanomyces invadans]|eukprot:XP_008876292.1 hypothetical protein H310_11394 [Aphanomyces invadans]
MSYRRACKSCQKKSTADPVLSATSREACECEGMYRLSDSHLDEIISTGATRMTILPDLDAALPESTPPPSLADMERHLALLYTSLTTTTTAVTATSALVDHVIQLFFPEGKVNPRALESTESLPKILVALLRGRATLDEFLRRNAHSILDQSNLSRAYEQWLAQVYHQVCRITHESHATSSVYFESLGSNEETHASESSRIGASYARSKGFEAFVAQLREVYLAQNYSRPSKTFSSALNGTWRLDIPSLRIVSSELAPSILSVVRCLSMGLGFHVVLSSTSLFVRSELALFTTIWSEFILDNTPRILRVFPNGESTMSMCADLLYGDYVGSHTPHNAGVRLDLYCWPLHDNPHRSCYAIRMLFQPTAGHDLHGQVDVQVAHNVRNQNTWNMTAAERMELVHRHSFSTVLVVVGGWKQSAPNDVVNVWV